ncbi:hypothetical protein GQ53DRAFT_828759 [Thozetella sp. PMI_491]|nr:hypothetical protein GQ53DRAFT_828759 [Thozetella sp. PMI_491]
MRLIATTAVLAAFAPGLYALDTEPSPASSPAPTPSPSATTPGPLVSLWSSDASNCSDSSTFYLQDTLSGSTNCTTFANVTRSVALEVINPLFVLICSLNMYTDDTCTTEGSEEDFDLCFAVPPGKDTWKSWKFNCTSED